MTLTTTIKCQECEKTIRNARPNQRFHSDACRKRAQRKRRLAVRQCPLRPIAKELPDPIMVAQNAVVSLTHGLKGVGEELGLAELVEKAEAAMDEFEEAFNTVDDCFDIWSRALENQGG